MKKKICSWVFLFTIFGNIAFSQSGWYQQESGTTAALYSIYYVDFNTGWISGANGTILKTINSGNDWIPQSSNTDVHLVVIYFLNEKTGFASGFRSNVYPIVGYKSVIMKTTDGGIVWDTIDTSTDYYITSINFVNSSTGYFAGGLYAGGPNKILSTTDGGNTLAEQSSTDKGILYSVNFVNSNSGYLSGVFGKIYKTTNGGAEWNVQTVLPINMLNSITFLNENTGYVAGGNFSFQGSGTPSSYIGKTTNGGLNWITQLDTAGYFLSQIYFTDQNTGYVCGSPDFTDESGCYQNKIYKTTNSGTEWVELSTPIIQSFLSIYFNNANTGFAVGCNGKILKTINGGVTGINSFSNEIPSQYKLEQNYPNPFNPTTNLEFGISKLGFVSVKIYDLIGKEVATIVNKNLSPGTYKYEFDGSNFSSGIYFYKLVSGDFTAVKRMVLMK